MIDNNMFDINWKYKVKVFGDNSKCYAVLRNTSGKDIGNCWQNFTVTYNGKDRYDFTPSSLYIECVEAAYDARLFIYLSENEIALCCASIPYIDKGETVTIPEAIVIS